jgi:hypothetical protein
VLYLPCTDTWSRLSGVCLDLTKKSKQLGDLLLAKKQRLRIKSQSPELCFRAWTGQGAQDRPKDGTFFAACSGLRDPLRTDTQPTTHEECGPSTSQNLIRPTNEAILFPYSHLHIYRQPRNCGDFSR